MSEYNTIPAAAEPSKDFSSMARRRYQKGTLELHNGNWTVRYLEDVQTVGSDKPKRIGKRVYLGGSPPQMTEKLARRRADEIMVGINSTNTPRMIMTFNEFITRWEPLSMPKTETARNFRTALNKYLKPAFGPVQLADIQTERLQRFISTVPTGAPNIHNIVKCLRAVWKSARAWGYAKHNPFDGLVMPTIEKTEPRFFTYEEVCRILTAAPEPDKTLYWILAQTGLRIGEVLALTWETVDLENSIIQISATVARGKLRDRTTKTKSSKRLIPLSPRLQEHLSIFRTRLWRDNPNNLLFANSKQKPWKADNLLTHHLQPLLAELKIETAGFHAFRHASATILSLMKVPMEIRLARMGHTEEEMTLRYTHVIDTAAREVASGFDQFLLPEIAVGA